MIFWDVTQYSYEKFCWMVPPSFVGCPLGLHFNSEDREPDELLLDPIFDPEYGGDMNMLCLSVAETLGVTIQKNTFFNILKFVHMDFFPGACNTFLTVRIF
jgi:hypothetical protein